MAIKFDFLLGKIRLKDLDGGAPPPPAVVSVFGRAGAVIKEAGDYNASDVTNDSGVAGSTTKDALNTLNSNKANTSHTHTKSEITDFNEGDYATALQGSRADSASQPGEPVGQFANNVGYLVASDIAGKENTLVAGSNISIDRTNPLAPVISAVMVPPSASEVSQTTLSTTTSTTFVLVPSITTVPGAGTFLVMFSGRWRITIANAWLEASLFVNGVQVATSNRRWTNGAAPTVASMDNTVAFQEKVTVTAGQVVEVRWRINGGIATGSFFERKMSLIRVS